jgi:4-hydroxy-tetrahydrodipicolinate synthase
MQIQRIVGIKDSSGDPAQFDAFLSLRPERPDWSFFVGPEHLTARAVARGGDGGVNGGANLRPRLFVDLYAAARSGDAPRVARLQEQVERLGRLYRIGRGAAAVIQGLKCALSLSGICDDYLAEPFCRFEGPERLKVHQLLDELDQEAEH